MTLLNSRLKQQMDFLLEIDKVKNIFRMTSVTGNEEKMMRSIWHLGIMAFLFNINKNV